MCARVYVCGALPSPHPPNIIISSHKRIPIHTKTQTYIYIVTHSALVCRVAHIKYDFPRDGKYIFLILCILACVENVFRYISWGVEWDTYAHTVEREYPFVGWHKLAYTQGEYFICENLKNRYIPLALRNKIFPPITLNFQCLLLNPLSSHPST